MRLGRQWSDEQTNPNPWRLGIDIGGTFTDVALEGSDQRFTAKVLTTPDAPEEGVLTAINQAMAAAHLLPSADI